MTRFTGLPGKFPWNKAKSRHEKVALKLLGVFKPAVGDLDNVCRIVKTEDKKY